MALYASHLKRAFYFALHVEGHWVMYDFADACCFAVHIFLRYLTFDKVIISISTIRLFDIIFVEDAALFPKFSLQGFDADRPRGYSGFEA